MTAASRVPSSTTPAHTYRVTFEKAGSEYRAEIVDDTAPRSRRLKDKGPSCAPIAQAVAVVLATMWGSEGDAPEPPPPLTPTPTPAFPPELPPAPPSSPPRSVRWTLGAGPALAVGVVRAAAPAVLAEAAVARAPWSLGLSALWIPDQTLPLGPGAIDVQLLAAGARGCVFAGSEGHFGVCGRLMGGMLWATATGFDIDGRGTRPWLAGGAESFVDGPLGVSWLRYRCAAGVLVPLHAEAFSVSGVGAAYETPALAGLFTLAIEYVIR
jgi:hypothetical protein